MTDEALYLLEELLIWTRSRSRNLNHNTNQNTLKIHTMLLNKILVQHHLLKKSIMVEGRKKSKYIRVRTQVSWQIRENKTMWLEAKKGLSVHCLTMQERSSEVKESLHHLVRMGLGVVFLWFGCVGFFFFCLLFWLFGFF